MTRAVAGLGVEDRRSVASVKVPVLTLSCAPLVPRSGDVASKPALRHFESPVRDGRRDQPTVHQRMYVCLSLPPVTKVVLDARHTPLLWQLRQTVTRPLFTFHFRHGSHE